jgi:hypothetical protein
MLKNITTNSVSLQLFRTTTPVVNGTSKDIVLSLTPGEAVDETLWRVNDLTSPSYNGDLIDGFITSGILTRV